MAIQIVKMLWLNYGFVYLLPKHEMLHEYSLNAALPRWPFWEFQANLFLWLQDGFNSDFTPLAFICTSDRQQKVTANPEELRQCVPEVAEALQPQPRREQDEDINYPSISSCLRQSKVDLASASQMNFPFLFHQIGSANVWPPGPSVISADEWELIIKNTCTNSQP